MKQVNSMKQV